MILARINNFTIAAIFFLGDSIFITIFYKYLYFIEAKNDFF